MVFVHNVRSLSQHIDDIVSDDRITNNDIAGFREKQINPSDSSCKNIETINFSNITFNNNKNNNNNNNINNNNNNSNRFLSSAYIYRNDVAVLIKFDVNGVSISGFKDYVFSDRIFNNIKFHQYYSRRLQ